MSVNYRSLIFLLSTSICIAGIPTRIKADEQNLYESVKDNINE